MTRLRLRHLCLAAAVLGAAFGGPGADGRALAAAAGTAFEAAPFLLAAAFLARLGRSRLTSARRFRPLLQLAGCGCSRGKMPGALALAAIAVSALSFGPAITAARTGGALAVLRWRRRAAERRPASTGPKTCLSRDDNDDDDDPLFTLERVAASAFVASLAVAATGDAAHVPWPVLFLAGLAVGTIAPCAVAGVAIASAFAHDAPAAAIGVLCTAGMLPWPPFAFTLRAAQRAEAGASVSVAFVALAIALGALATLGPSGLVNPRLLVPIGIAGAVAAVLACMGAPRTRSAWPLAVPALMLFALVHPAPLPPARAEATRLDEAYAGERLSFTGAARRTGPQTTLVREAITCCRLDATPIAVRLDRALAARDGTWIDAHGMLVRDATGALVLRTDRAHAVAPPADPFVYR